MFLLVISKSDDLVGIFLNLVKGRRIPILWYLETSRSILNIDRRLNDTWNHLLLAILVESLSSKFFVIWWNCDWRRLLFSVCWIFTIDTVNGFILFERIPSDHLSVRFRFAVGKSGILLFDQGWYMHIVLLDACIDLPLNILLFPLRQLGSYFFTIS